MPSSDPADSHESKAIVRSGGRPVSSIYRPWKSREDPFGHGLADLHDRLGPILGAMPKGSEILDLGCGCGIPDARLLADRFRVTGMDISDVQVDRAHALVPDAKFVRPDMVEVLFPEESFRAVLCLNAIVHVPLEGQRSLLDRIYRWLVPSGLFLVVTREHEPTGAEPSWLGSNVEIFWSPTVAETYEGWLREAGFEVRERSPFPEPAAGHALFLAAKPGR